MQCGSGAASLTVTVTVFWTLPFQKFLLWLGVVGTSFGAAATAFAVVQATLAYDRIAFAAFSILLLTAHLTVLIMHWLQKWWLLHVYILLQAGEFALGMAMDLPVDERPKNGAAN